MKKFQTFTGIVVPLDRSNVDTDAIIPKQFLKSIHRTGFGPNLFDEWRYLDYGEPGKNCDDRPLNSEFVLNKDRYKNASILITGKNFGCGSSREHAPWALADYGFKVIISTSFADIFYNNCFKNGILPIVLGKNEIKSLFKNTIREIGFSLSVNLKESVIIEPSGKKIKFEIEKFRKDALLNGMDEIGITLSKSQKIRLFESKHHKNQPWLLTKI